MSRRHQQNSDAMKTLRMGGESQLIVRGDDGEWHTFRVAPPPEDLDAPFRAIILCGTPKRLRLGDYSGKDGFRFIGRKLAMHIRPKQVIARVLE